MADEYDIYGDDGLGGVGLGGDDDDFLYGDLTGDTKADIKEEPTTDSVEKDRRISHTFSDVVDYELDENGPPAERESKPTELPAINQPKSEQNGAVPPSQPETQPGGIPGIGFSAPPASSANVDAPIAPPGSQRPAGSGSKALYVEDLTWWTSDEDVKLAITEAGVVDQLDQLELSFAEHRVNGKSKGICYIPFYTPEAAVRAKEFFEQIEIHGRKPAVKLLPPTHQGNPFRTVPKDPKEARLEAAMRRTPQAAVASPALPGAPSVGTAAAGGSSATLAPTATGAGRGTSSGRGRGGYQQAGYGRGGYMSGSGPGYYDPDFFPPPHAMGAPYPDQPGFRGGYGRGGMRGGYPGGGAGRDGYGYYDRGPYGPGGHYFEGPEYDYEGYGPGYGRGGPPPRGFARPYPPGHRGPPGASYGRDAPPEHEGSSTHRRAPSPSGRGDGDAERESVDGSHKPESIAAKESEHADSKAKIEKGSMGHDFEGAMDHKRSSTAPSHASGYYPPERPTDRHHYYDERYGYHERHDARRHGYGRDYERERDRYRERERDRRRSGAEVFIKERDTDDFGRERRESYDERRDYNRSRRSRDRSRDSRTGRDERNRRESDVSAHFDGYNITDAAPSVKQERGRSLSPRPAQKSPSPVVADESKADPMDVATNSPHKSRERSPSRTYSRSRSRSRSRSQESRHRKRKSRSHSREGGEGEGGEASGSSKRRKSKHKSSRRHKSSRSSRRDKDGHRDKDERRESRSERDGRKESRSEREERKERERRERREGSDMKKE